MIDKGFNHQWTPNATTFEAKPKPVDGCIRYVSLHTLRLARPLERTPEHRKINTACHHILPSTIDDEGSEILNQKTSCLPIFYVEHSLIE